MTNKLLGANDVFRCLVVVGNRCGSKIMTLYIFAVPCEEPTDPLAMIVRWVAACTRFEHDIIVLGMHMPLKSIDGMICFLVKDHLAGRCLLGIESHHSEALSIRLIALEVTECEPNDILEPQSALMQ